MENTINNNDYHSKSELEYHVWRRHLKVVKKLKVLIIVDSIFDFMLMKQVLKNTSTIKMKIEHAPSVEEGLEQVRTQEYDVVINDLIHDGEVQMEVLDQILELKPRIGLIALTGVEEESVLQEIAIRRVPLVVKSEKLAASLVVSIYHVVLREVERRSMREKIMEFVEKSKFGFLVFKVAGSGMVMLYQNLKGIKDYLQEPENEFVQKTALYYFIGVGQGESYHTGVYVLPVNDISNYVAVSGAFRIPDKNSDDERLQLGYVLFNYFIPKDVLYDLPPLPWLEETFRELLIREIKDVSELSQKTLHKLNSSLYKRILGYY